ncbi:hypothetical protein MSG28_002204 [Choristoneura fumiferana]|uniref:Uncharacterized protein n=1 Tax=Choristoneura fumiferana TaxID=7141 RepID=A0ACC0JUC5_CHOFU|nr:hypothetical protein MSG28_002204 [Choristoneura fumiferana]
MKPTVAADEMFPEGVGPWMDLEEVCFEIIKARGDISARAARASLHVYVAAVIAVLRRLLSLCSRCSFFLALSLPLPFTRFIIFHSII